MEKTPSRRSDVQGLLSRQSLARNTILNLLGHGIPLVVGLVTIPFVLQQLGTDRIGLLTLAWALMGYFSMFDLGLGRAITQSVAAKLGQEDNAQIARAVWSGLALMGVFGAISAMAGFALSPWLVHSALKIPSSLREEALWAFIALSASIPIMVMSSGFAGLLSALQRFDVLNALRVPVGMSTFLVPAAVLLLSNSLFHVCLALVVARALFLVLYVIASFRVFPALRSGIGLAGAELVRLARFGGWMTVSNVVGPLMVYMDRFLIGVGLSTTAVAFYAVPFEVVTRLWIIPAAVVSSLFPAFATAKVTDFSRAPSLFSTGATFILLPLIPVVLTVVVFAEDLLAIWLGYEFAQHGTVVLQLLIVGVYINSLAHVPFALVQGIGRPDLTAKLHVLELPIYGACLVWLLGRFGIEGVAIAWLMRIALDTVLLMIIAYVLVPGLRATTQRVLTLGLAPLPFFVVGANLESDATKLAFLCIASVSLGLLIYFCAFSQVERRAGWARLRAFLASRGFR